MIGIGIRIGVIKTSNPVLVVVATSATGVGETSFTANWNPYSGAQYYLLDVSTSSSFSSFVLQNQVVSTNSYIVTGLTASTTYYYRVRASTDPDPDAQAFFSRVTTAGGTLSTTEKNAVNQLVIDLKANSLWTPMKAIYPMVGSSAASCAQNLKSSSFTGSFTPGWTFSSTGATPNGTSAYFDTGLNYSSNIGNNTSHQSFYSRTFQNAAAGEMGSFGGGQDNEFFLSYSGTLYGYNGSSVVSAFSQSNQTKGFYLLNAYNLQLKAFKNNSVISNTSSLTSYGAANYNVYIGAPNNAGNAYLFSSKECAFSSIGNGLTDTQASNFYTTVQKFNQSLNRQVGAQLVSDPDAQAYIDRVYTAGGTLTNTEATAVNQLTIDLKSNGTWSSMKAIYPMIGASAAACAQNLKSASFTGTFSSGWTFASTGVTPNGTSAYMDTAFNPSTNSSLNSGSIGAYINNGTTGSTIMGAVVTSPPSATQLIPTELGTTMYGDIHDSSLSGTSNTIKNAFFQASRINSTQKIHGVNTTITTISGVSTTLTNLNIYIGGRNVNGSYSSGYSSRIALIYIGNGLTTTEMTNYYTAVQAFQTTIGRAIAP